MEPDPKFDEVYYDENDGAALPQDRAIEGVRRELDFMAKLEVGKKGATLLTSQRDESVGRTLVPST